MHTKEELVDPLKHDDEQRTIITDPVTGLSYVTTTTTETTTLNPDGSVTSVRATILARTLDGRLAHDGVVFACRSCQAQPLHRLAITFCAACAATVCHSCAHPSAAGTLCISCDKAMRRKTRIA